MVGEMLRGRIGNCRIAHFHRLRLREAIAAKQGKLVADVVTQTGFQEIAGLPRPARVAIHLSAEIHAAHRVFRCSFCAYAWELKTFACGYCGEGGEAFVIFAGSADRPDRRIEICGRCGGYLKTVDVEELSPFPMLAIADLETMDLDLAAMEKGYRRPVLKDFRRR